MYIRITYLNLCKFLCCDGVSILINPNATSAIWKHIYYNLTSHSVCNIPYFVMVWFHEELDNNIGQYARIKTKQNSSNVFMMCKRICGYYFSVIPVDKGSALGES